MDSLKGDIIMGPHFRTDVFVESPYHATKSSNLYALRVCLDDFLELYRIQILLLASLVLEYK